MCDSDSQAVVNEEPKRRWYQFSLRTLLIAVFLVSLPLSWYAVKTKRGRRQAEDAAAVIQIAREQPWLISQPESSDDGEWESYVERQIDWIRSPMVLRPVAKDPEIRGLQVVNAGDDPVKWMSERLRVTRLEESDLFKVWFEHPDPTIVVTVSNAVLGEYFKRHRDRDVAQQYEVIERLNEVGHRRAEEFEHLYEIVRSSRESEEDQESEADTDAGSQRTEAVELEFLEIELAAKKEVLLRIKQRLEELETERGAPSRVHLRRWAAVPKQAER